MGVNSRAFDDMPQFLAVGALFFFCLGACFGWMLRSSMRRWKGIERYDIAKTCTRIVVLFQDTVVVAIIIGLFLSVLVCSNLFHFSFLIANKNCRSFFCRNDLQKQKNFS
jgi:hypothetical protein